MKYYEFPINKILSVVKHMFDFTIKLSVNNHVILFFDNDKRVAIFEIKIIL